MSQRSTQSPTGKESRLSPLQWYLSSNAITMLGMGLQQMLTNYILVEMLETDGVELGTARMLMQLPPLMLMLVGGATADRIDPRALLIGTQSAAAVPAIVLAFAAGFDMLGYWLVVSLSIVGGVLGSFSGPARQSILNNVAKGGIQRAISLSTGTGNLASIIGYAIFSRTSDLGIEAVLVMQSVAILFGAISVARLAAMPPPPREGPEPAGLAERSADTLKTIKEGITACWHERTIGTVILVNFVSGFFNTGAWMVVFPLVIREFYTGAGIDFAESFALAQGAFTVGSIAISFILLRFMPIHRPGRLFLWTHIGRIVIYTLVFLNPPLWGLLIVTLFWGINLNLSMTMSRSIIQELAPPSHRASILAVASVGQMSSVPIGAILLGWIADEFGTLQAMLPGPVSSVLIFVAALFLTDIWAYLSVQVRKEKEADDLTTDVVD